MAAMAARNIDVGSQYLIAYLDRDGNALDDSKTYKIHLPPDVPAKDFWSFTLYDNQTRSMLQTDQRQPGVDNLGEVKANADGSYDIYFGPEGPGGWRTTGSRLCPARAGTRSSVSTAPLQPFYDKTWKPGDPELAS